MTAIGVTRLKKRDGRYVLAGAVRRRVFRRAPRSVALRLSGLTLAQTTPSRDASDADNVWTFQFILSGDLEAIVTKGAPLAVLADAVELPFSPKVQALRSAMTEDPERVLEVVAKLRDGYVLTTKGELREPYATRGRGLAAVLDQYEHCDRVCHEILGRHLHVVGGTFLGAARQGGAIDHDVDFDAAYLSSARDVATLKAEYLAFLGALLRRGETIGLVNHSGRIRRRHFRWRSKGTGLPGGGPVEIDVFPAFIDPEGFYCRPTFVRIPGGENLILPLRRVAFEDREVWAPNRMVEKATQIFGPSWRVADPFWSKPVFPGMKAALEGLALTDEDLLMLAADMPARQAAQLREAVAAGG